MKWAIILLISAAVFAGLGYQAAQSSTMNVMGRTVPVDEELFTALANAYGPGGMYSTQTTADISALRKKHQAYKAKSVYFGIAIVAALAGASIIIYPKIHRVGPEGP